MSCSGLLFLAVHEYGGQRSLQGSAEALPLSLCGISHQDWYPTVATWPELCCYFPPSPSTAPELAVCQPLLCRAEGAERAAAQEGSVRSLSAAGTGTLHGFGWVRGKGQQHVCNFSLLNANGDQIAESQQSSRKYCFLDVS